MRKILSILVFILLVFTFSYAAGNPALNMRLKDLKGKSLSVKKFNKDNVLLISFWATWCSPCKKEMLHLQKLYEKYQDKGLTVLSINEDSQRSMSKVKSYIKSHKYTFPILLDPEGSFLKRFTNEAIPFTLIFNKKGEKIYSHLGYMPGDEKEIEKIILKLIK